MFNCGILSICGKTILLAGRKYISRGTGEYPLPPFVEQGEQNLNLFCRGSYSAPGI